MDRAGHAFLFKDEPWREGRTRLDGNRRSVLVDARCTLGHDPGRSDIRCIVTHHVR